MTSLFVTQSRRPWSATDFSASSRPTVAQLSPEIQRTKSSRNKINSVLNTTVSTMANILGKFYYITVLKHSFQTLYILQIDYSYFIVILDTYLINQMLFLSKLKRNAGLSTGIILAQCQRRVRCMASKILQDQYQTFFAYTDDQYLHSNIQIQESIIISENILAAAAFFLAI